MNDVDIYYTLINIVFIYNEYLCFWSEQNGGLVWIFNGFSQFLICKKINNEMSHSIAMANEQLLQHLINNIDDVFGMYIFRSVDSF